MQSFRQLAFLLFFLLPQNVILAVAVDVWPQRDSQHFLLVAEPTAQTASVSLADWDAILRQFIEQLDAKYAPLFGGETLAQTQPSLGQKPLLLLCASKASYLQRLADFGVANPADAVGSGGYYHPDANVIFSWRQPTEYYSRHVVLHEVAHWYCWQQLGRRYTQMPLWFCEGLADHAAYHTWDGKNLRAIQLPRVSLENYPARLDALLKRLSQNRSVGEISPEGVTVAFERLRAGQEADTVYDEYALAWGMAAFLVEQFPREMTQFFELLRQNSVSDSWQLAFEDVVNHPTWRQLADWVAEHRHPWLWVWNHWEDTGQHLLGISDSTAMIVQNPVYKTQKTAEEQHESDVTLLRCEVTPLLDRTVIGLVFRYESSERFAMLQFRNVTNDTAQWRLLRFEQKQWEEVQNIEHRAVICDHGDQNTERMCNGIALEIRRVTLPEGQKLRFFCDGHVVLELPDDTETLPFGLVVQSGAAVFLDLLRQNVKNR